MAKFGRFEFGKTEPVETYEGDYMAMERGYVRIFEGELGAVLPSMIPPRLVAAIHLGDKVYSPWIIGPRIIHQPSVMVGQGDWDVQMGLRRH